MDNRINVVLKMNEKLGLPGSNAIVDETGKLFKQNGSATKAEKVK